MAITTIATGNSVVGPAEFADMVQALAPRFLIERPTDLAPVWRNGRLEISSGAATVAGTRVRVSGTESVGLAAPSSGSRVYAVVLRVDWSKTGAETAKLVALGGTTSAPAVNSTARPNQAQINRIPGVLYDALIAVVVRTSTAASVADMRVWGADGGPLRVGDQALASPSWLDLRPGAMIATDRGISTRRLDDDGVWRDVRTDSNPWRTWDPVLRYYENAQINGVSGGKLVGAGNGAVKSARYRVVDGMLDGYIYWQPGNTGATLGKGPITIDLPLPCANWQEDTWSMGHLYTFGYGGDGNYDWHAEMLVKKGWTRGMVWASPRIDDCRLRPYQACDMSGNPGTGVPYIAGGYAVGTLTFHVNYPVDV